MEHRKKRKTRKCKQKLGKTLTENAEKIVPRITGITRIRQAKAWFYLLAENAEKIVPRITGITRIGQAKAWFYLLAENAENADFTIPFQ